MEELITTGAVTVGYETSWGERVRLAVCADRYERGGALALLALDATDPGDEDEYLELWCSLTVNLPGDPVERFPLQQPGTGGFGLLLRPRR